MGDEPRKLGQQLLPAAVTVTSGQASFHQLPVGGSPLLNCSLLVGEAHKVTVIQGRQTFQAAPRHRRMEFQAGLSRY